MLASSMLRPVRGNVRGYERRLRDIEHELSEAAARELRLEQEIALKLAGIAGLHVDQLHGLEREAQEALRLRGEEESALRRGLEAAEAEIAAALDQAEASQQEILGARKQVAEALARDADFKQALAQREQEGRRQREPSAMRELRQECERKLAAYRQDARYAYLAAAGYGTEAYRRSGLVRFLDGWIAKLCNYHANRSNELTLLAMREQLDREEKEGGERMQALNGALARMTAEQEKAVGLDKLMAALGRQEAGIRAGKQRAKEIQARLASYADKSDPRYREARSLVAMALKSHSEEELMAHVRQTPGGADDALAQGAIALQSELRTLRGRIAALEAERQAASADYGRAKELERTLRQPGYAGRRYEYRPGLDMASLIMGYMAGSLTIGQAADAIGQYRQDAPDAFPPGPFSNDWGNGGLSDVFDTSDFSGGGDFWSSDSF